MLNAFWRERSFLALSLFFFLLFSFSATYANEERDSGNLDAPLSLESDVALPEGLWPAGDNSAAEVPEEAPSMAVIPPPPLDPPPLKQLTLMLDWYLSPQHAALIVAKERALFAAQGLEIELLTPADPSIAIKLLAAGEVDLALTRQPLLHLHAHDGAPITRIATLIETPLNAVIVAGEAPAPAAVAVFGRLAAGAAADRRVVEQGRFDEAEPLRAWDPGTLIEQHVLGRQRRPAVRVQAADGAGVGVAQVEARHVGGRVAAELALEICEPGERAMAGIAQRLVQRGAGIAVQVAHDVLDALATLGLDAGMHVAHRRIAAGVACGAADVVGIEGADDRRGIGTAGGVGGQALVRTLYGFCGTLDEPGGQAGGEVHGAAHHRMGHLVGNHAVGVLRVTAAVG